MFLTRIDVGGSAAGTQTGYAVYDSKQDQHRPMVEGIVNTEGTNAAGFYYDYGAIDEVAVETKGHTAEMPWPGVWSNFISKSGGNTYHGKLYADYQAKGIQARNIDDSATFLCPGGRCGNPRCHCHERDDPGHGPFYRLTRKVDGKTVTETFSTPAALRKAQNEVAEYHRFRELSRDLLEVNEKICRARLVEGTLTPQEKKRPRRSTPKSLAN